MYNYEALVFRALSQSFVFELISSLNALTCISSQYCSLSLSLCDALYPISKLTIRAGDEALNASGYTPKYPIRHGVIEDWDLMERFWEQAIFKYLRAEPEDHYVLLVRFLSKTNHLTWKLVHVYHHFTCVRPNVTSSSSS